MESIAVTYVGTNAYMAVRNTVILLCDLLYCKRITYSTTPHFGGINKYLLSMDLGSMNRKQVLKSGFRWSISFIETALDQWKACILVRHTILTSVDVRTENKHWFLLHTLLKIWFLEFNHVLKSTSSLTHSVKKGNSTCSSHLF